MWEWNEERQLFVNDETGESLPLSEMEDLINDIIDDGMDEADDLADQYLDSEIDERNPRVRLWWLLFSKQLRDLYFLLAGLGIGSSLLVIGGLLDDVNRLLNRQFTYLDSMAGEILSGALSLGSINRRIHMYVNSSRSSYWVGRDEFERRKGSREEHWITLGDTHVCTPCNEAEDLGWQLIGTFAQPGSGIVVITPTTLCRGMTSCRCKKSYR